MNVSRVHLRRCAGGIVIAIAMLVVTASIDPDWTRADERSGWMVPKGEILGTIETRNRRIVIRASDDGPRYDVYDLAGGPPFAVDLTAEDLSASFPDVPLEGVDFSAPAEGAPYLIMIAPPADGGP